MNLLAARQELLRSLQNIYDEREAAQIADWVMEHVTKLTRSERLIRSSEDLTPEMLIAYDRCREELMRWRPVQYVMGEAWFAGMRLKADERALIPRPETEELVEWCISDFQKHQRGLPDEPIRMLDIGTGTGCIALALQKAFPSAEVWAADKSRDALALAMENASLHQLPIKPVCLDALQPASWESLPFFHLIISNPPYVLQSDSKDMRENVLAYEPHMALFADHEDPLVFYHAIAEGACQHLLPGCSLFFEIHENKGQEVAGLLKGYGFSDVALRKDISGRDRMICAKKP